ncbi:hypothetical protein FRB95_008200 [Tulasnella sp. JGI-2019a]|nr:hypothetical protein FRB95_008200 [Tulasnella sp. JGI-2019a]
MIRRGAIEGEIITVDAVMLDDTPGYELSDKVATKSTTNILKHGGCEDQIGVHNGPTRTDKIF